VRRFLANPRDGLQRLDRFSRLWPLSACFGVFGFLAARALIDGYATTAVVFGLLTVIFLGLLVWVLHVSARS
jgi:hypothetical protein